MVTFDNYFNQSRTAFGETIFVFVVPSVLHFVGFLTAVYVLRIADNEQLQNLVERVSASITNLCSVKHRHHSGVHIVSTSQPAVFNALVLHCLWTDLVDVDGVVHRFCGKSFGWRR